MSSLDKTRQNRMKELISSAMSPVTLIITNESDKHKHHAGDDGTGETHYDMMIISDKFLNMTRVARQRYIYDLLGDEFKLGLHALSLKLYTEHEASLL